MNIFIETNFVLELALEQQEHSACEHLLDLALDRKIRLLVPAYSLVEPHETLTRRHRDRDALRSSISAELNQLARSAPLAQRAQTSRGVVELLVESAAHELKQLENAKEKICAVAEVIPLTVAVLQRSAECQRKYDLSPQDAVVYASMITILEIEHAMSSCFISRNPADFDNPDLRSELAELNCKYFASFTTALEYIEHSIGAPGI